MVMGKIYYERIGEGRPVICLHGNQENRTIFYELANALKDEYQMILIDSRYHGKSVKEGELSLSQMSKDVMSVVNSLNLDEYDVIGFSDGANIALTLALKDSRLKNMVLLAPNSDVKALKWPYRLLMRMQVIGYLPFCLYHPVARRKRKLTKWMLEEPHFSEEMLQKIKIPTLLLGGERDMIKEEDFLRISSLLPYCKYEVIANSSHFMMIDAFPVVLKKIRGFLYACHR
ncbi:hypothetical protein IV49_GL000427 [Kandleria vitulina DSM 20405]|jgi:pimeloyl-ACP methyl ester carboxylesterase|uniref:AB hydrolase-1 domain-containing protein n=2 Tax=Kandleria vitulina TaxID=1630 RepID=A0A0R2HLD2_9FIRM|nr:alpha/beta hydrolase [Kandleria vitulina]KRN50077.1 hypothetical protein IV49_GL000427 [Kandleria vitulina DSM 20405]